MSLFKRLFGRKNKEEVKEEQNTEVVIQDNKQEKTVEDLGVKQEGEKLITEPVHEEVINEMVDETINGQVNLEIQDVIGMDKPVIEEPVIEEPVIEEPVIEEPVIEEPVIEEPVIEEPVIEEPVIEEPVIEEPVIEEPVIEEPVIEEPVIEESVIEEPVIEEEIEKIEEVVGTSNEEEMLPTEPIQKQEKKEGFIKKLFSGLSKTRDSILKGVDEVLSTFKHIDEDLYEELEEALIMADFGVDTTMNIMETLREYVKNHKITEPLELRKALQVIITEMLTSQPIPEMLSEDKPTVILVIGVNGVGKTTTIGKLAHLFKQNNKKVVLAAADTFRAAAINQLQVWADRAGVDLIKHEEGSDAAAVIFDAICAAKSRKSDVLICDTAGRLQNKVNLMKELEKISRIIEREYPEAKKEILIVLDATTGQNAIQQVKLFKEVADINGIILSKLDGTAKGGAIVGIYNTMQVPVKYIGVGESIGDIQPFDAHAFAKALFNEK